MHDRAASPLGATVIVLSIALPSLLMLLPGRSVWAMGPAALLLLSAIWMRALPAVQVSLFCFLFYKFIDKIKILRM